MSQFARENPDNWEELMEAGYVTQSRPRPELRVCPQCNGEGKMVNRAVSVWTQSDIAEDPEGFEDMMEGVHDVVCDMCLGEKVISKERYVEFVQEQEDHRTMLAEQGIYPGSKDYF